MHKKGSPHKITKDKTVSCNNISLTLILTQHIECDKTPAFRITDHIVLSYLLYSAINMAKAKAKGAVDTIDELMWIERYRSGKSAEMV